VAGAGGIVVVTIDETSCVLCGLCTGVCPPNALELTRERLEVLAHCTDCGWCVPFCPVGAISGVRLKTARRSGRL
ncbi:4Fe-4S ferredoxin iron-sulfur-binding domain-containing protein, partial [mine drainage metagenome]